MPNRDKTGPEGEGELTGNALGNCDKETLGTESEGVYDPQYGGRRRRRDQLDISPSNSDDERKSFRDEKYKECMNNTYEHKQS